MESFDWKTLGRLALKFFLEKVLPLLIASLSGAAAYDQCVTRPAVQLMQSQNCGCQK